MKFVNLYILNMLWALIGVFVLMAYGISKRKKIMTAFADAGILPSISPGFSQKRRWFKAVLIIAAFVFAVIALAGPQLGYRWEKTTEKGVDIMIALDCSKSMLAKDISPNRLERAKREIVDLLRMMRSDRAGLVAFSGNAFLQCPLTLDHEAFHIFLNALEPGFLPVGGTNLEAAIQTSYEGFEVESDTQKAIIIITDGESTTGGAEDAAQKMAGLGIKIFTIGVGDLSGAPVPDDEGGFKKDASGNIVLSRVDEKGLQKIASLTAGTYVRSVAGDMDLDVIYTEKILGGMEKRTLRSGKKKVWENRYQWFLFPCLVLLLVELALPSKRKRKAFTALSIAIGLCFLVLSDRPVSAKMVSSSVKEGVRAYDEQAYEKAKKHFIDAQLEDPEKLELYYNIGAAAYKNNEYEQALENFLQAAKTKNKDMKNKTLFNLANTYYRMGKLDEAITGYETLLKEFPEDAQAKENLDFVKKKAEEEKKNQDQKDQDQKDQDKESEDNKDPKNKDQQNKTENQQDKGKNKPEQKKQEGQQKSTDQDKDSGQDQGQQEQPPEPKEQEADLNKSQKSSGGAAKKNIDKQAQKQMEQMLNRLEDKPGQAMIPVTGGHNVEKDW